MYRVSRRVNFIDDWLFFPVIFVFTLSPSCLFLRGNNLYLVSTLLVNSRSAWRLQIPKIKYFFSIICKEWIFFKILNVFYRGIFQHFQDFKTHLRFKIIFSSERKPILIFFEFPFEFGYKQLEGTNKYLRTKIHLFRWNNLQTSINTTEKNHKKLKKM